MSILERIARREALRKATGRCAKCRGRGVIDANVCHGFGTHREHLFPCGACEGTGRAFQGEFIEDAGEREQLMRDAEMP